MGPPALRPVWCVCGVVLGRRGGDGDGCVALRRAPGSLQSPEDELRRRRHRGIYREFALNVTPPPYSPPRASPTLVRRGPAPCPARRSWSCVVARAGAWGTYMCAELSLPNYYNIEAKDTPSQLPLHESCPPPVPEKVHTGVNAARRDRRETGLGAAVRVPRKATSDDDNGCLTAHSSRRGESRA